MLDVSHHEFLVLSPDVSYPVRGTPVFSTFPPKPTCA